MIGRTVFAAAIVLLFSYVTAPLFIPLAMGAVFAVLAGPWAESLERKKMSPRSGAFLITISITFLFLLPTAVLIFFGAKVGLEQLQSLQRDDPTASIASLLESQKFHSFVEKISAWVPVGEDQLVQMAKDLAGMIGVKLGEAITVFLGHIPSFFMALAVIVVSLYYFLVDGPSLITLLRRHSWFTPVQTEQLLHAITLMCRSVIAATVISGTVQTIVFMIGCMATATPNLVLVTFLIFVSSFVPLVGSMPVTMGVVLYHFFAGNTASFIVLLVLAFLVSLLDNLIRPLVLKGAGNLHPLLAFVAAFGGLQVLGIAGIFIGPIIAGLFVATVQILVEK